MEATVWCVQIRESLQSLQNSVVTVATEAVETPGVSTASVVNKNTPISVTVATPDPLVTLLWCSFAARSCDKHTDLLLLTCPGDSVCTCSPCVLLGFYACFALVRPHYLTDIHVSSAGNYTPLNEWPSFRKASVFITWPKRSLVVKVDLVDLLVQRCIFILSVFLIMSSDVFGHPCEWKPRPASNTPCFLFLYLRYHLKEIIPNMIIWGSTSKSRNKNKKRLWKCSRALKWNCTEGRHHSA